MMKNTSRVQPAALPVRSMRRRRLRVATLAAIFALFALYVAWHEARGPGERHNDELPITQAHADDASQPSNAAGTPAAVAGGDLVKRGEYLARVGDCVACHTADKSRPFAGGLPINTPVGTIVAAGSVWPRAH